MELTKKDVKKRYETAEIATFPEDAKLLLICINKTLGKRNLRLLDAVRYSWKISRERAEQAEYVLAVAFGLILDIFEVQGKWMPATKKNFPYIPDDHGNWDQQEGRSGFQGRPAAEEIRTMYRWKRVPDEYRNHGAPIRYVHM